MGAKIAFLVSFVEVVSLVFVVCFVAIDMIVVVLGVFLRRERWIAPSCSMGLLSATMAKATMKNHVRTATTEKT